MITTRICARNAARRSRRINRRRTTETAAQIRGRAAASIQATAVLTVRVVRIVPIAATAVRTVRIVPIAATAVPIARIAPTLEVFVRMRNAMYLIIKICAFPYLCLRFRLKKLYESPATKRAIGGNHIVVMNHSHAFDPRVLFYAFYKFRLSFLASELVFARGAVTTFFVKTLGAIRVDRNALDVSYYRPALNALKENRILCVFPEGRINKRKDAVQPFKASFVQLALKGNAKVIPIFSDGNGNPFKPTRLMLGDPMDLKALYDGNKTARENYEYLSMVIHDKVIELRNLLKERGKTAKP
jgi:1-acyl-sn-glycerol-3-phosphate acyltransferase